MDPNQNQTAPEQPNQPVQPEVPPAPAPAPTPGVSPAGWGDASPEANPQPLAPTTPAPAETPPVVAVGDFGSTATQPVMASSSPMPPAKPKRRFLKPFLIILAVLIVLGGGAAAAYFAVIVPNQPKNVLKTALENSLQAKQVSFKGNLTADPTHPTSGVALKMDFNGSGDLVNKTSDLILNATVTGVSFNVETRYVNQNLYIKPGDLSNITNMLSGFIPSEAAQAQSVSNQLSNKWIVVDSTLLKQMGLSCIMDNNISPTSADIKMLEANYQKSQFVTINKTSSDSVNGSAATKFDLTLNDDKASGYLNSLKNLPTAKSVSACENTHNLNPSVVKGDHKATPLTVWVDKQFKRISQIQLTTTQADSKTTGEKGTATVTLAYKPVAVTAPADAQPLLTVVANVEKTLNLPTSGSTSLDLNNLFGSSSSNSTLQ